MNAIVIRRLELIPGTAELVLAEMENPERFFDLLGVARADDWPSENLGGILPLFLEELQNPATVGWLAGTGSTERRTRSSAGMAARDDHPKMGRPKSATRPAPHTGAVGTPPRP